MDLLADLTIKEKMITIFVNQQFPGMFMHLPFDGGGPEERMEQFLQSQDTAAGIKKSPSGPGFEVLHLIQTGRSV